MFTPSKYQQAIFDFILNDKGNAIVEAVAGSGKTKTIEEVIKLLNPCLHICYLVFNKKNQLEAAQKLPSHVTVSTLNAFGHKLCCRAYGSSKPDVRKTRNILMNLANYDNLSKEEQKKIWKWGYSIEKLVSLAKGYAWHDMSGIEDLAGKHDIELPTNKIGQVDPQYLHLLTATFEASIKNTAIRDFDDQIYMPVMNDFDMPFYDIVFIDECQDLNPIKIALVKKLNENGSRIIAVGDRHQAIYGFAGADVLAIQTLQNVLKAKILPLSVCYRCCKSVVDYAKQYVPQIEPFELAPVGTILTKSLTEYDKAIRVGDYVLCRITAPLVSECLKRIREGVKAVVLGREILESLLSMLDKVVGSCDIETALTRLDDYYIRESDKLKKLHADNQLILLQDKVETLRVIMAESDDLLMVKSKLNSIFSDTAAGITHMTMHKAKGLEADRVYILKPELVPHKLATQDWQLEQENNLMYVAVTRAKMELIFVA